MNVYSASAETCVKLRIISPVSAWLKTTQGFVALVNVSGRTSACANLDFPVGTVKIFGALPAMAFQTAILLSAAVMGPVWQKTSATAMAATPAQTAVFRSPGIVTGCRMTIRMSVLVTATALILTHANAIRIGPDGSAIQTNGRALEFQITIPVPVMGSKVTALRMMFASVSRGIKVRSANLQSRRAGGATLDQTTRWFVPVGVTAKRICAPVNRDTMGTIVSLTPFVLVWADSIPTCAVGSGSV